MTGTRDYDQEAVKNAVEGRPVCCPPCGPEHFGAKAYDRHDLAGMPQGAIEASMAWGNPVALAELRPGDVVLDLGCGGGLDVLLAARDVAPTGKVIGVDILEGMIEVARKHAEQADAAGVEFLVGSIEHLPLPDDYVDVVLANGTVSLSGDKPAMLAETYRVLKPAGRFVCTDFVLPDGLDEPRRKQAGELVACTGAIAASEYVRELGRAGFLKPAVSLGAEVSTDMFLGVLTATKPRQPAAVVEAAE